MLISQDCTARSDQTIEKYFIMLRMQIRLTFPNTILAKHAEVTVSTDQQGKTWVLSPHMCKLH